MVELRRRRRRLDGGAAAELPVGLVDLSDRLHLALLLHPPVLEPDLDLSLGQRQLARQLDAPAARQVAVELEVFLELERLVAGVRLTAAPALRRVGTYTAQPRTHQTTNTILPQTDPRDAAPLPQVYAVRQKKGNQLSFVCVFFILDTVS